jgi:predicted MFS family arabinose efflux permease
MVAAYLSDRLRHRWLFSVFPALISLSGFAVLTTYPKSLHVRYGALFLAATGAFSSMPVLLGWFNTNLAGHKRRAVGSAFQVAFGNIGAIIASYSFVAEDAPKYEKGFIIALTFTCLSIASSTAYFLGCWWENRQRDKKGEGRREDADLGDMDPSYRYLL